MQQRKWSFPVLKAARWASTGERDQEPSSLFEDWVLWVRAADLPTNLPLDPNARHPDISGSTPKAIAATLRNEPAEFVKRNGGITMVARSCRIKDSVATLVLNVVDEQEEHEDGRRGDGILNGGHTYAVMMEVLSEPAVLGDNGEEGAQPDPREAVVRIEVQTGLAESDLPDISRARNKHTPVAEYSLKNLGNVWNTIKKELTPEIRSRVAFMENDPDAPDADYDVGDLVQLLALFNNKLYPITGSKDPIAAYTSEKRLITNWRVEDYAHLVPQLPTLINLRDDVILLYPKVMGKAGKVNGVISYKGDPLTLLSGKQSDYWIPNPFTFPVLAALRAFLSDDGKKWFVQPKTLIKDPEYAKALVEEAWRQYRSTAKSSAAFFGRNRQVWRMLALTALVRRQAMEAKAAS